MSVPSHFKLNTGGSIPAVGLGTWQAKPGEVGKAVSHALKCGYRHLDCALIYQNEKEVGEAVKASGIPREEIFITSKVWNTHQDNVAEGLAQTLKDLQTDYLDLYLIHWPVRLVPNETSQLLPTNPDGTRAVDRAWNQQDTWKQMEQAYRSGKVRAIGVSNFSVPYLEDLEKTWEVIPAVNQVELHPYCPQHALKEWCAKRGILLEAYCPLGSTGSPLLSDSELVAIAAKYNVSPATILISYQVNRGCVVLPKSVTPSRIESNLQVISLHKEDLDILEVMAAAGKQQRVNTPLWGHDLGFDDWYGPGNVNAPKQ
ncbi:NADP-dependent oxidoreductase domain-containing protein [Aspergillus pseudoustus]|uniref:D-xylose reductase [NAD(P)H] n=1 Tax=Aspergillus pseudoustus TaxID=1810923 RepID=A0ABR4J5N0_9EURO